MDRKHLLAGPQLGIRFEIVSRNSKTSSLTDPISYPVEMLTFYSAIISRVVHGVESYPYCWISDNTLWIRTGNPRPFLDLFVWMNRSCSHDASYLPLEEVIKIPERYILAVSCAYAVRIRSLEHLIQPLANQLKNKVLAFEEVRRLTDPANDLLPELRRPIFDSFIKKLCLSALPETEKYFAHGKANETFNYYTEQQMLELKSAYNLENVDKVLELWRRKDIDGYNKFKLSDALHRSMRNEMVGRMR